MVSLRSSGILAAVVAGALSSAVAALAGPGWTVVAAPSAATNSLLDGAAARTDTDVWAVGTAFGPAGSAPPPPIAYHWNGTAWSLTPTPTLAVPAGLLAVSASSVSDAWAVGFTVAAGYRANRSLFEHWNGTTWSVVAGAEAGRLVGVAAFSATNAWTVSSQGVVEHWNGTAWTIVSTPQPNPSNTFGNRVSAMSADGPSDIWMLGTYDTASYTTAIYALHYDGSAWSVVPVAQPATGTPSLGAVTALSPTSAWAVGQAGAAVLAEHWDGRAWTLLPAFSGVVYPSFKGIAARSATDVWAVGSQVSQTQNALLLHWDGRRWSTASAPPGSSSLYAATTTPGGSRVWAFGAGVANHAPLILSHG